MATVLTMPLTRVPTKMLGPPTAIKTDVWTILTETACPTTSTYVRTPPLIRMAGEGRRLSAGGRCACSGVLLLRPEVFPHEDIEVMVTVMDEDGDGGRLTASLVVDGIPLRASRSSQNGTGPFQVTWNASVWATPWVATAPLWTSS